MSSNRFPGKMLSPLKGRPVLWWVTQRILQANIDIERVVVLTSTDSSDDPLAAYSASIGLKVFRGPLNDVFHRFLLGHEANESQWIVRVTGDSPFVSPDLFQFVIAQIKLDICPFITTTFKRTLPKGMNLEAFKPELLGLLPNRDHMSPEEKEHVTKYWHNHRPPSGLLSIELDQHDLSHMSVAIDTLEDLRLAGEGRFDDIADNVPWEILIAKKFE